MITEWGMSDKLGMIAYGDNSQEVFLGHSVTQTKNVSEATAREIDAEIKDIIDRRLRQGAAHPDRERRGTASAGARPAGARDAVRRRNPHGAAWRAGDPQGGGRAGAGEPPRLGAECRPSRAAAARRRPGPRATAGLSNIPRHTRGQRFCHEFLAGMPWRTLTGSGCWSLPVSMEFKGSHFARAVLGRPVLRGVPVQLPGRMVRAIGQRQPMPSGADRAGEDVPGQGSPGRGHSVASLR